MTIARARKIMGECAMSMSDKQVQAIIDCFNQIIEVGFQLFEAKNIKKTFDNAKTKEAY